MTFHEQLTIINEENGWGKSTFAAFCRAMFYGLEVSRAQNNERKRYEPWQGGKYGGNITFEANGKRYRLERFFGKREKEDTFRLYDDESGLESADFTDNIGCELFGIDRDSYNKSAYISQGETEIEIDKTGSISAKLLHLVDSENDMNRFDEAVARLEKQAKQYDKIVGAKGSHTEEIRKLQREIEEYEAELPAYDRCKDEFAQTKQQYQQLKEEKKEADRKMLLREKQKQFKMLSEEVAKAEDAMKECRSKLLAVPDEETLGKIKKASEDYKTTKILSENNRFPVEKEGELYSLLDREIRVSEEEVEEVRMAAKTYAEAKAEVNRVSVDEGERMRLGFLEGFFGDHVPTEEEIGRMFSLCTKTADLKSKIAEENGRLEILSADKSARIMAVGLFVMAFLCIGGGIALMLSGALYGIALIVCGVVPAIIGILRLIDRKGRTKRNEARENLRRLTQEKDGGETALDEFLTRYNMPKDDPASQLSEINRYLGEYRTLQKKKETAERLEAESDFPGMKAKIIRLSTPYLPNLPDSCDEIASELEKAYKKQQYIEALKEEKKKSDQLAAATETARSALKTLFAPYIDAPEDHAYELLHGAMDRFTLTCDGYREAKRRMEDFAAENPEATASTEMEEEPDIRALEKALEDTERAISFYEHRIDEFEDHLDKCDGLRETLETTMAEAEEIRRKLRIVQRAAEGLKEANETMGKTYLGPIRDAFENYIEKLSAPGQVQIDSEFHVGIRDFGEQHPSKAYSAGLRDVFGISLRFALIDALFENETPVVIMDDPFVNLDKERLMSARAMLDKLSEKYQILYFVCHESRE